MENVSAAEAESGRRIRNGLVWYAALLPALGLFLENYTLNKYLGFLVWGVVIVMRPLCCLLDMRQLERLGAEDNSRWWALLPTVYLFRRCLRLKTNTAMAVVCMICLSYGIIGNGFVSALFVDDERILEVVRNESVTSVKELRSFGGSDSFGDALDKTAADGVSWQLEADGNTRFVTASLKEKTNNDTVTLVFRVTHDGYTYTEFKLDKVTRNGTEVTDDARSELLKALFSDES